jgi:hypothetical protein
MGQKREKMFTDPWISQKVSGISEKIPLHPAFEWEMVELLGKGPPKCKTKNSTSTFLA